MSQSLQSFSDEMAKAVENAGHSIVRAETRRRMAATGIAWSADLVITSNHAVEREDNLRVGLPNGQTAEAHLVGRDPATDLALLRVSGATLTPATWEPTANVKVGQIVLALGRPGENVMASLGVVSALEKGEKMGVSTLEYLLRTDVVMYPGFSGGPLLAANGNLIGLNTSAVMRDSSITITATTIQRVAETLSKHGKMKRGYLGVGAQPVKLPEGLGQEVGLLLMSVEPNSPAAASLFLGDTLLSLNGIVLSSSEALTSNLTSALIGQSAALKVLRGGKVHDIAVTIGERP
jgi:S1-C subfamily serine protease